VSAGLWQADLDSSGHSSRIGQLKHFSAPFKKTYNNRVMLWRLSMPETENAKHTGTVGAVQFGQGGSDWGWGRL